MSHRTDLSPMTRLMRQMDALADGGSSPDTVPTGFPSLDKLLGGGLRRGDLIVLGGDVGSGKSALALALALRVSQAERVVALASGEMTPDRVLERALAMEGRARVDDLRRGALDDAGRASVGAAAVRLRDASPLVIEMSSGVEPLAEELRRVLDLELAIVDPLHALARGMRDEAEELAAALRQLKTLALELGAAVVVTAQVPELARRERQDLRPTLRDFGALGAVGHHADVVLAIFREDMYAGAAPGIEGATELRALKNRNGATGYVDLFFYQQWMRFEDVLDPE